MEDMAGDQLAIWNQVSVGSNAPIPSTHLTIFVPPALGAFILANLKSPQGESPQLDLSLLPSHIHPRSSPHLDPFTLTSLLSTLNMKTSSWTMLAKQRRLVSSDLNLSLFSPLPMKVFTVGSLVGRYAFQCQRRILPALLVDSHPLSLSNRAPIAQRH